jgi:hypothetical protein
MSSLRRACTPVFSSLVRPTPKSYRIGGKLIDTVDALSISGIPLLWFAAPLSTFFWLVGSSTILILGHASLMEPGVER